MKPSLFASAAFAAACALPAAAHANQSADPITGYAAFMSEYIGRGLSQSVGQPSVQAELDYNNTGAGFYAGVDGTSINWIDQVYPGDSVSLEVDGYSGYRWISGDWTYKIGLLRMQFPGRYVPQTPSVAEPNTTEGFGFIGWRGLSAKLNYAITDAFATPDSRGSWYFDLSAGHPVGDNWTLGAHLGRKQERGVDPITGAPNSRSSYTDYKLSIAHTFGASLSLTLEYTWTNADPALYTLNGHNVAGHHFTVTLEKDF